MSDEIIHTTNDISRLAHLINQKNLNRNLYDKKLIPQSLYDSVEQQLLKKIDCLEKKCYNIHIK